MNDLEAREVSIEDALVNWLHRRAGTRQKYAVDESLDALFKGHSVSAEGQGVAS
jgi:hypothetical protein